MASGVSSLCWRRSSNTLFLSICLLSFHHSPGNRSRSLITASESKQFLALGKQESLRASSEQDDKEGRLVWFCLGGCRPGTARQLERFLPAASRSTLLFTRPRGAQSSSPVLQSLGTRPPPACSTQQSGFCPADTFLYAAPLHLPFFFPLHLSTAGPRWAPRSPSPCPTVPPQARGDPSRPRGSQSFQNLLEDVDHPWGNPRRP